MRRRAAKFNAFIDKCEHYVVHAEPIEPGNAVVVMSPPVTGVFAHESFGHKSEADFMLGDPSMLEDWKLGTQVASRMSCPSWIAESPSAPATWPSTTRDSAQARRT